MFKFIARFLKDIKFFSSLDILIASKNIKPKIIFFSENKVYQKFSKPLLTLLFHRHHIKYFIYINKDDQIDNKRVIIILLVHYC